MTLALTKIFGANPMDDRYWPGLPGIMDNASTAPATVGSALKIPVVWRAVNVLASAAAVLPIDVFDCTDDLRVIAKDEPLRRKLRRKPNRAQTSFRWRHHMIGQLLLTGNYYAQKVRRPGGPIEQLWPLEPTRMRVTDILPGGDLQYVYRKRSGGEAPMTSREVLHIRGFSIDGMTGVSVIDLMRDAVTQAVAARKQRLRFIQNELRPSVVITHPKPLTEAAEGNLLKGYKRAYSGPEKSGEAMVLAEGAAITSFQISNRDAQWIESQNFDVEEFLRFLGVPGVLCGYTADKAGSFAATEAFLQSFVTHSLWPITGNVEDELSDALFGEDERDLDLPERVVKMNMNALLRADSTARANFYRAMVELGILTRNEVRALEDRNPLEGLDEPLTPMNMGGAKPGSSGSAPPAREPAPPEEEPAPDDAEEEARAAELRRARLVTTRVATRLVRKEVGALAGGDGRRGLAQRYAGDDAGWRAQVARLYDEHPALLVRELGLSEAAARGYCAQQAAAVLAGGVAVVGSWESERVAVLVRLALQAD